MNKKYNRSTEAGVRRWLASRPNVAVRAVLAMVAASFFIAVATLLAKGIAGHFELPSTTQVLHPLQITAGRFIFGWLIWLVVLAVVRPSWQPIHWQLHIGRSFFGWLGVSAIFWSSSLMVLADATAISFLSPVITLFLAIVFLHERVGVVRFSAVAIMLTGALILLRPGGSAFQPAALIAMLAAFAGAIEGIFIKRITALEPRLQVLFVNNSIGLLIALVAAYFVWVAPSPAQWIMLAVLGMVMAAAQVFFLTSMRDAEASFVTPFIYTTLIFASLLDYWIFADAPDRIGAVGAAVIVAGAAFLAIREGQLARRKQ